jgi:transcriptional regulator with XRE-family HTH domain
VTLAARHICFPRAFNKALTAQNTTTTELATKLGYKADSLVQMWSQGRSLPELSTLVRVAHALATPAEDLLLPWCADTAPEHVADFWIIADQLLGEGGADALLYGDNDGSR